VHHRRSERHQLSAVRRVFRALKAFQSKKSVGPEESIRQLIRPALIGCQWKAENVLAFSADGGGVLARSFHWPSLAVGAREPTVAERFHKINLWNRVKALELLMKHFGLLKSPTPQHVDRVVIEWDLPATVGPTANRGHKLSRVEAQHGGTFLLGDAKAPIRSWVRMALAPSGPRFAAPAPSGRHCIAAH
jgi:hypothetical protein